MWWAQTATERAPIHQRRANQADIPEHGLAAEDREDLGHDAEERQRDDVDLGVPEEPEQVLPQDRAAVGGIEHVSPQPAVRLQRQQCRAEDWERDQDQHAGLDRAAVPAVSTGELG
jgi:hypothetical protein